MYNETALQILQSRFYTQHQLKTIQKIEYNLCIYVLYENFYLWFYWCLVLNTMWDGDMIQIDFAEPENGNRLYNNEQYNVNVESVKLLKDYRETSDEQTLIFSTYDTEHIVARYEFTNVTGVHTASVVWINPNGRISAWAEEMITHTDGSNYVWFGLNTADMEQSDSGEWRILLFIDGRYVLTNFFNVSCEKKKAIHSFNVII